MEYPTNGKHFHTIQGDTMPEVFTVIEEIRLDAPAHGIGYQYRVAYGIERWPDDDGKVSKVRVCKVQMVNPQGQVLGRQAPSYPTEAEWSAVKEAMERLMTVMREAQETKTMTVREMIEEAARAFETTHHNGFTEANLCAYLDEKHPRQDGRPWGQNMTLAGDYAVWADNGEGCTPSAADVHPKFLERISARNERPMRYRSRTAIASH